MEKKWWKEGVMYQIYPRSFKDSNGDGIGDLQGIIEKADYLSNLGINMVWLGPIYDSPNDDNGYDISDYRKIHPDFGTMADFEQLLDAFHARGIKLIMDLVVNHTSDEHEWFIEARKSKESMYRDYYFWQDEPNNYLSYFGGSAWEHADETDQYYLHLFSKKQPDLNWENPKVRQEVYDIMKFWLNKGIDGFRMDVISLISKRTDFHSSDTLDIKDMIENHYANGPRIHEFLQEMYDVVLSKYDVMTVGEGPGITKDHVLDYVGADRKELNMIFQLDLMFLDFGPDGKFDYQPFTWQEAKEVMVSWDQAIGELGWNNIFLDNHDFPRMVSRFGNDKTFRYQSATLLAMFLLTFRGTPCIYQGSEIGMTNVEFPSLDDYDDIETQNMRTFFVDGNRMSETEFLKIVHIQSRDNARTPMQWSAGRNAGFTSGEPWIKINPNYMDINFESDLLSKRSIYRFYQELINFRKDNHELIYGDLEDLAPLQHNVFFYRRNSYKILLNFSDETAALDLEVEPIKAWFNNYPKFVIDRRTVQLQPWQAIIFQ